METRLIKQETTEGGKWLSFSELLWKTSGVVAGGKAGPSPSPPSDNFSGALKSKGGAKIRNSNVKYYTKYVKSSLSTNSKIVM